MEPEECLLPACDCQDYPCEHGRMEAGEVLNGWGMTPRRKHSQAECLALIEEIRRA